MTKYDYPEEVPLLTEADIIKRHLDSSDGERHCLLGWCKEVFSTIPILTSSRNNLSKALGKSLREAYGDEVLNIANFNDTRPKSMTARVWNRAMYLLGYKVDNPESKPLTPASR